MQKMSFVQAGKRKIAYLPIGKGSALSQKTRLLVLLGLGTIMSVATFAATAHYGLANAQQNNTLIQPQGAQSMATNANNMNIVLVHGAWVDGSSWSKVIPILQNAGYKVIALQLPLHSLADDVATVKHAIDLVGGPTILVGHSFGGFIITNAAYNNQNVPGLVYVSAFAPDEGESAATYVDVATLPPGLLVSDSGGFAYLNPEMFHEAFIKDANATEAETLAVVQKPAHQSLFTDPSGPPAWKQLPSWFEVSEGDHIIPPDVQRNFAKRMNATTISLNSSHASLVTHPDEIAELILNATKGVTK
jgi:pimeloyl-ACP methyl ester carboxylesterase